MTNATRNRPGGKAEAIEAQAGRPFAHSEFTGDIDLTEISAGSSNPRFEVYLRGWAEGRESLAAVVARLSWERDLWYFVANNKGKTAADFYPHLTTRLWDEASI